MISRKDLKKIARNRLKDAEMLLVGRRYQGAIYICGYAIEIALKARICKTLKWQGFPENRKEFENLKSLKTHNLDILLSLSGVEGKIKTNHLADWSVVATWDPETRYKSTSKVLKSDAQNMIESTNRLIKLL